MSSNNQLIILKKGNGYEVHENSCVDNDFFADEDSLLRKEKTLSMAIKFANKYMVDNLVEYGIDIEESALG